MANQHYKTNDCLRRIDAIAEQVAALVGDEPFRADLSILLSMQEQIDEVLWALFGKNLQLDEHAVRLWPIDNIDSRMHINCFSPPMMSEDLLRAAAQLRKIKHDFERNPANALEEQLVKNGDLDNDGGPVFLIHGHDHFWRDLVKGFLAELDVQVVVSQEAPTGGLTIAEIIDEAGSASFAVAVLTPDDVGRAKNQKTGTESVRARQNVIYELGYFAGRLGRHRVCMLVDGDLELPSDINGQVFIKLNEPDWKTRLVREMRSAGIPIDLDGWI